MKRLLLGTAIALLVPAAAQATAPIYYGPVSEASASTFGPYVGGGQVSIVSAAIKNGVVDQGSTYDGTGGSQLSTSHSADGYTNSANVLSNTGNGASATADLHNGTVRVSTANGTGPLLRSGAQGGISDTLYFNNTSGATIFMPYSFAFDGSISGGNTAGSRATSTLYTYGVGGCGADFNNCPGLQLTGGANALAGLNITFGADGSTNITNYGDPRLGPSYQVSQNHAGDYFSAIVSAVLEIPVGYALFSFQLRGDLDCSGANTACDFSHTSLFNFPSLPAGLTYSSASGAFQINAPAEPGNPGAVPEPATWAMMLMGFFAIGSAMRRRKTDRTLSFV